MQMLARNYVFARYICESSGKHQQLLQPNNIVCKSFSLFVIKSTGKMVARFRWSSFRGAEYVGHIKK